MHQVNKVVIFFLVWLFVPSGAFAQYHGGSVVDAAVTTLAHHESAALTERASVKITYSSETLQNRGDPLMPVLYFGTMDTAVGPEAPDLSGIHDGTYAGLVRLSQAEDGPPLEEDNEEDEFPEDEMPATIADPFEPINRAFYHFNDKLYFWLLKPLATGYSVITPEPLRIGIRNFYENLAFPIRFFNCLFQGKTVEAGEEMRRFTMNTIMGLGGFFDLASREGIKKYDEDLGQTLGKWGMGPGFYMTWPVLGPSSVRGTIGFVGDSFLYPVSYIFEPSGYTLAFNAFDYFNQTSLRLGDYEDLKKAAFDPYIALRDAYYQNRLAKIKE